MMTSHKTYGDLEVNHLLGKGGEFVVEAEAVFTRVVGGEDIVSLALFGAFHEGALVGADDRVVYIEGPSRLNLTTAMSEEKSGQVWELGPLLQTYREIERNLGSLVLDICEEAGLLMSQ
jgi:hypothetical protein